MKKVLTIAGSDCSGGAGIQADLKTMAAHGVYGMSAITALTAQNTRGVYGIQEAAPEFLGKQLDCIFTDIFPDAVKIGMLFSEGNVKVTAEKLRQYEPKHIVADPVMVSTSGHRLICREAEQMLKEELFPLAELITPNLPEAEALTGIKITGEESVEQAARLLEEQFGCGVLIKGGHGKNKADDLLCSQGRLMWIRGRRVENPNSHGTGCTLSSAIAANLAKGYSLEEAVRRGKEYVTKALEMQLNLGAGSGPMDHTLGGSLFRGDR